LQAFRAFLSCLSAFRADPVVLIDKTTVTKHAVTNQEVVLDHDDCFVNHPPDSRWSG
jgi:hypothetical protein